MKTCGEERNVETNWNRDTRALRLDACTRVSQRPPPSRQFLYTPSMALPAENENLDYTKLIRLPLDSIPVEDPDEEVGKASILDFSDHPSYRLHVRYSCCTLSFVQARCRMDRLHSQALALWIRRQMSLPYPSISLLANCWHPHMKAPIPTEGGSHGRRS